MTRADFKTIKSFCQILFNQSCSLESNFLLFSHNRDAFSRAQFVHAKMRLRSDRKYYKKNVMIMISENDDFSRSLYVFLSSFRACLAEVTVRQTR